MEKSSKKGKTKKNSKKGMIEETEVSAIVANANTNVKTLTKNKRKNNIKYTESVLDLRNPNHIADDLKSTMTLTKSEIENFQISYVETQLMENVMYELCCNDGFCSYIDLVDKNVFPDYYAIVSNPICFNTIIEKIRHMKYLSLESFILDLSYIITNCRTYNAETSELFKLTYKLEDEIRRLLLKYFISGYYDNISAKTIEVYRSTMKNFDKNIPEEIIQKMDIEDLEKIENDFIERYSISKINLFEEPYKLKKGNKKYIKTKQKIKNEVKRPEIIFKTGNDLCLMEDNVNSETLEFYQRFLVYKNLCELDKKDFAYNYLQNLFEKHASSLIVLNIKKDFQNYFLNIDKLGLSDMYRLNNTLFETEDLEEKTKTFKDEIQIEKTDDVELTNKSFGENIENEEVNIK